MALTDFQIMLNDMEYIKHTLTDNIIKDFIRGVCNRGICKDDKFNLAHTFNNLASLRCSVKPEREVEDLLAQFDPHAFCSPQTYKLGFRLSKTIKILHTNTTIENILSDAFVVYTHSLLCNNCICLLLCIMLYEFLPIHTFADQFVLSDFTYDDTDISHHMIKKLQYGYKETKYVEYKNILLILLQNNTRPFEIFKNRIKSHYRAYRNGFNLNLCSKRYLNFTQPGYGSVYIDKVLPIYRKPNKSDSEKRELEIDTLYKKIASAMYDHYIWDPILFNFDEYAYTKSINFKDIYNELILPGLTVSEKCIMYTVFRAMIRHRLIVGAIVDLINNPII